LRKTLPPFKADCRLRANSSRLPVQPDQQPNQFRWDKQVRVCSPLAIDQLSFGDASPGSIVRSQVNSDKQKLTGCVELGDNVMR
jgi:hypothetical protein